MQYAKTNDEGYVVALTSAEFTSDDWLSVDGAEDLLGSELVDQFGTPLYTIDNGRIIERAASDIENSNAENERMLEIETLKARLKETDYAIIKIAEGAATADEYADVILQRRIWRNEINALEQ